MSPQAPPRRTGPRPSRLAPLSGIISHRQLRYDLNASSKFGAEGKLAVANGELIASLSTPSEDPDASCYSRAVSPGEFKAVLGRFAPLFDNSQQQDASEFLMKLLEGLSEDLNRVEEKPSDVLSFPSVYGCGLL